VQLVEIYAPACLTPTSFEAEPPDWVEMESRVRKLWPNFPWLVAEQGERLLGYAYAGPHRARQAYAWTVESSIYLRPEAQGRGLGQILYRRLLDILQRQGYHSVLAGLTLPNPASLRLHQKLGFETVGIYPEIGFKQGRWHDTHWLSLRLNSGPAQKICPLTEIGETG